MKKQKLSLFLSLIALSSMVFTSCEKTDDVAYTLSNVETPSSIKSISSISNGIIVLNSGKMNGNNTSLTFCDLTTKNSYNDFFSGINNRGLGDTGQDIIQYGSKIYVGISTSSLVEVLNAKTGKSIKSISFVNDANAPRKVRSLAAYNGKIYLSLYDGHVARIDTTSLSVEKMIEVGSSPEQIIAANNKLYVVNSMPDSTISVIDPVTFTETKKITVAYNPTMIQADSYGDLYVVSMGNYYDVPITLQRVATTTDKVTTISGVTPFNIKLEGDNLYMYSYEYGSDWSIINKKYMIYNVKSESFSNSSFINTADITGVPYSLDINPTTKEIFIGETDYINPGKMYCFDANGKLKYTFSTGVNPMKTLFIK
ncbi:MAG: hypothetical protein Q8909_01630 [Bacteroidota bacterium]|nr:hypothetical protein [Bacteroidota bacterium]